MRNNKVAVVGIDGVSWEVLNRFIDNGVMPFLKNLLSSSAKGVLESVIPPWTPPAWTSIATGVNPGKHGIFSFYIVTKTAKEYHVRFATIFDVMYPRLHEIVDFYGLKSIIINLPLTYPANFTTARNAIIVSDWIGPKLTIYPRRFEKYKDYFDVNRKLEENKTELFLNGVLELAKYDYDLLFVIISETDWLMHEEGREILSGNITSRASRLMKLIDSFIREIYETAEYLLIVSDHGFSLNSNAIDLKSILEKSNMKCRRLGEAGVAFKVIGNRTLHIPGCFIKILRHPKVRHYAKRLFKRINIGKKTTRAFHSLKYEDCEVLLPDPGYIYTAPTLKKKVINILKECSALNVYTPNELYYGPYIKRAPDLIVWPKLGYGLDSSITHSLKGITLIAGKDLDVDKHVMKLRTWDVAPLILSLLGLPIPHDTDGNVKSLCKRLGVQLHGKRDYVSYWKVIKKIKTASIGKRNIRHAL